MAVSQGIKRTAMNTSLSVPVISSTTATSTITLSMIMKYEADTVTENATINQNLSMRDYSEERLFQAVYLGYLWTALIIGLPGNVVIAVVYVVIRQKRTSDWFIFFLSVYDCAVCVFAVPLYLSIETGAWVDSGSDLACKIEQFTIFTAQFSSVCMLGIIAVDRYLKICHPTKKSLNAVQARNLGFCISLVSAIVASPVLIWDGNVERRYCRVQEKYRGTLGVKAHLCLTFGFFLCVFFVVIFCYTHVCIVVRRRIKRHRENALKRKHLMQIPAFLQAISNVDDPHGLSGHPGGRNKKRFSLFSIGSNRRLSAISPWIKARLSLPSDGVGRRLANAEDEEVLASKDSLVDSKRQLDYALMFQTKSSSIEERYGDSKDCVFRASGEFRDNVDDIKRNDIFEDLHTVSRVSSDTYNMPLKREKNCNGLSRLKVNNSNHQGDDSVFEDQGGFQASHWDYSRADQECKSRVQGMPLSNLDLDSNVHKQETKVLIETNQSQVINDGVLLKTHTDEQITCGDLGNEESKCNRMHDMSQNINEENTSNDNAEIQTSGNVDDVCGKDGTSGFLGNNGCGLHSVHRCASSKKSCRTFHSECCRCQNESLQISNLRGNSTADLAECDFSNRCCANHMPDHSDSGSLSHSLLSLFTRSRKCNFRQLSPKGKGRGKGCRSASCLVSPKHIKKLSSSSVSEKTENISQSYTDLRVIQSCFTKPECLWKNGTHNTPSKSMAFEELNHSHTCGCERLYCDHHVRERDAEGACGKSPSKGSPVRVAFSPKKVVHQNMRSTLVRDLNYINMPYSKLINDEILDVSGEGERSLTSRRISCSPAEDINFLIGCGDDDDYVDDDVKKSLLDNSDTNRFAVYTSAELSDYGDVVENSTERADHMCPAIGMDENQHVSYSSIPRSYERDASEDYLNPINDENHVSKHKKDPERTLLLSEKIRDIYLNKRRSEKVNCRLHTDFEDSYRKTSDSVPKFEDSYRKTSDIVPKFEDSYGQSRIEPSNSRSCDRFTCANQKTCRQHLFGDVGDINSTITENSSEKSLCGNTFIICENTINNAAGTEMSYSVDTSSIGLSSLCDQGMSMSYKDKDVFQGYSNNVCGTVNGCSNTSPQDTKNTKHDAMGKELGHSESVNTSLDHAQTLDSPFARHKTSCQRNLQTNVHANSMDYGHNNDDCNDNMDISKSLGVFSELPSKLSSERGILSLYGSSDNHVLLKGNVPLGKDSHVFDTDDSSDIGSTRNIFFLPNEWVSYLNTSYEQEVVDHGEKLKAQDEGKFCRSGHICQSVKQMDTDQAVSENVTSGRKCTALKQNKCSAPKGYSTSAKLNVHYDHHCNKWDTTTRDLYSSRSPTQETDLLSGTVAKSVNCSSIYPESGELKAENISPEKRGQYIHSSNPSDNPYKVGVVSYHRCSACLAQDVEPDNECCRYLQPSWTSNWNEDAQLFKDHDKVQHDKATDSSNEEDVKRSSSIFNQHDQSLLCASSKDLQPSTIDSSNKNCFVDTHHQLRNRIATNESPNQTPDIYPATGSSPIPRKTGEYSPLEENTGRHPLDISPRLPAIPDKASEFDFPHCDECLVVSFIEFLSEKDISLLEQTIAAVFRTRLEKSMLENFCVSPMSLPQNILFTTSPYHFNFDIITLSSLHFLTNKSFLFHRSDFLWDIYFSTHFNLPTIQHLTPESAYAHLHTNPDFINNPLGLDMLEINYTFESSAESQITEMQSTLDSNTSLTDNVDVKSVMVDATNVIWTSSHSKTTPALISANIHHYGNFCHCKYFWSRLLKEFFNNEICPFCLKPVDLSGFSVVLHSIPSRLPLIYSDKGTFEKWLCKTELDRLCQKSMILGECPILFDGDRVRNGGNGIILCCSRLGTFEQNIASFDLACNRNITRLGEEDHRRLNAVETSVPVLGDRVGCQNDQLLNNDCTHTSQRTGNSDTGNSPSTTVSVNESAHVTSVISNEADGSSLVCSDTCDVYILSCSTPSFREEIPCGEIINSRQVDNDREEVDFNREDNMPQCEKKCSDNESYLQDCNTRKEHLNAMENTQSQPSTKIIQPIHEASVCGSSSWEHLKLPLESSPQHPNDRMRQLKLFSGNIVNSALNSLVPLAVGRTKHEVCSHQIPNHRRNSLHKTSTPTHQHTIPLDIEIGSSSKTTSENGDNAMALPGTTKTIHSALLGCVPTFQVEDFEQKSSLQEVKVPRLETCQFFVRTVFDTFFTSNSYPFKSDPCLSASDIDYANSELLVFPLSPLFCRTAHLNKENNDHMKDASVYHIDDRRRQSLNSAFDIYDARIRKIRSPKRNGPTQSWFSLDDLSSKPTSSRHASMVFLASLRRQLNNVLSPKSIRQFFGINHQQDSKMAARRPPCSRDTLSTNQINVIITRCDSLVMDKRQEMGLPPIRDRAATLDPASLDKSTRVSHNSTPSNMGSSVAFEGRTKPRACSLDTSYSSNTHSDDPSFLCRSQDLSIGRSRGASLDLLSPTSASFRTGSMCSGISNLSKLTECSAYTEHSRSDCEKITRRTAEREHNITKLLGVITLVFVLSWSVSWSVILIDNLDVFPVTSMRATNVTLSIARNLFLVNHFCNILVYIVLSRSFRDKMSECYTRCLGCCRV